MHKEVANKSDFFPSQPAKNSFCKIELDLFLKKMPIYIFGISQGLCLGISLCILHFAFLHQKNSTCPAQSLVLRKTIAFIW
jgi:hypothetical protein